MNSASVPSAPLSKLASLSFLLPRRCPRQQLSTVLKSRSPPLCLLSTRSFANKRVLCPSTAIPTRARELTTPRATTRLNHRPAFAAASHLPFRRQQARFCSSEGNSSFFAMASDRDILPSWYVILPFIYRFHMLVADLTGSNRHTILSPYTTLSLAEASVTREPLPSPQTSPKMTDSTTSYSMLTRSKSTAPSSRRERRPSPPKTSHMMRNANE